MAGIYIHIPFCRSKCAYCDFYSTASAVAAAEYIDAIANEAYFRKNEIDEPYTTLYIGGGTPAMLPTQLIRTLLTKIYNVFDINRFEEITIEANPEDISYDFISFCKDVKINRISIGIQSFNNRHLELIGRKHSAEQSITALETLSKSGINFNADLIYGLPEQSPQQFADDLVTLLQFNPQHFSAYLLSYEPGTPLYIRMQKGLLNEASESVATEMYNMLCKMAEAAGYNHYEISNFAKPGMEALHNTAYWKYIPYLGLGAAAHSFDGEMRRVNPRNIKSYIAGINGFCSSENNFLPFCEEVETEENRLNDYIITALRTTNGLDLEFVRTRFGATLYNQLLENIQSLNSRLKIDAARVSINESDWIKSDALLRELIIV